MQVITLIALNSQSLRRHLKLMGKSIMIVANKKSSEHKAYLVVDGEPIDI